MVLSPEQEGVIKFCLEFDDRPFLLDSSLLHELNLCRTQLLQAQLLGEDPDRYDGYGFGNISFRLPEEDEQYVITGTQTGHLSLLSQVDIACITGTNIEQNTLYAFGHCKPSSESMTHAALYQSCPEAQCVIHVHSPEIWQKSEILGLPSTSSDIAYGTVEMARAVQRLSQSACLKHEPFIFGMKGHEDGIVAVGTTLADCTQALLHLQDQALTMA